MRALQGLTTFLLLFASTMALADCGTVRFGYVNQNRPPYYLGNSEQEARPAGASVDLVREIINSAGCNMKSIRMPLLRVRQSLELGTIDAAPIDAVGTDVLNFAFPLDKQGNLDREKAVPLVTVVFVRASDKLAKDLDPISYFKSRRIGVIHGAPYGQALRQAGFQVDDGAVDAMRSLEKLARGRIDGFAVALNAPQAMDGLIEQNFGKDLVRLDTPIGVTHLWLAFNKNFYARNREQVDAMWNWFGANGRRRFIEILKTYEKPAR